MRLPKSPREIVTFLEPGATVLSEEPLAGGRSGSAVYSLQIKGSETEPIEESIGGYRILKTTAKPPGRHAGEGERHRLCEQHATAFMGRYAPKIHPKSKSDEDWTYLLFTVANTQVDAKTVSLSLGDGRLPQVLKQLSRLLLDGSGNQDPFSFNSRPSLLSTVTCKELLDRWVGYRIDPEDDRSIRIRSIRDHVSIQNEVRVGHRTMCIDPLHACSRKDFGDFKLASVFKGWLHGDLHMRNVLCPAHVSDGAQLWIIDFEKSSEGPLLYDHAYLLVDLLLTLDCNLDERILLELLGRSPARQPDVAVELVRQSIANIDAGIEGWKARNEAHGVDIQRQWKLALLGAGIDWANKRYDVNDAYKAARAYKVAAFAATSFFDSEGLAVVLPEAIASPSQHKGLSTPGLDNASDSIEVLRRVESAPEASLSGLLILNALLLSDHSWEDLRKQVGEIVFWKLRNGKPLTDPEVGVLQQASAVRELFEDYRNVAPFLRAPDITSANLEGYERRCELLGRKNTKANQEILELLRHKKDFGKAEWLGDDVKQTLRDVVKEKALSYRTWLLRRSYYHAGIRLTAKQMADAAVADFGHIRWQTVINKEPSRAYPHLRKANEKIATVLAERLGMTDTVSILEGGTGGGHTTFYVLSELSKKSQVSKIKYLGMELVPALSEELNAMIISPEREGTDEREKLYRQLNEKGRLERFRTGGRAVLTGRMEDTICRLWDQMRTHSPGQNSAPDSIDAFITSFAFHHVPNGEAIIRYISNDSQGFQETLDQDRNREAIASAIAEGAKRIYEAEELGADRAAKRQEIVASVPDQCPQAAVFLSLFEPNAVTNEEVTTFCRVIREQYSFPRGLLRRMLRNPQREVLLTAQSLLRDGGLVVIADPDGTSDFNAQHAYSDYELTIANFLSSEELRRQLDELGFEGIEGYRLVDGEDKGIEVNPDSLGGRWDSACGSGKPDLGYIVVARRDMCRERELSGFNRRSAPRLEMSAFSDDDRVETLGERLRAAGSDGVRIIENVFMPADPVPHSGQIFLNYPDIRRNLHALGWLQTVDGAAVVATKRIHHFEVGSGVFIATDFPPTLQENRLKTATVFSYSDEALALLPRLEALMEDELRVPRNGRVLDLCSGAGTLGILAARLRQDVTVCCVDIEPRAVHQARVNRRLNGVSSTRLEAIKGDMWNFYNGAEKPLFHLIMADPPFTLRSRSTEPINPDDGGEYGDEHTRNILVRAADYLVRRGTLLLLAYSLVKRGGTRESRIDEFFQNRNLGELLEGRFELVAPNAGQEHSYVWRFRHDKIAENSDKGLRLSYLAIRLGDPTRPEAITFQSAFRQRTEFKRQTEWLERLQAHDYTRLKYLIGEFRRRS